jgi:hypothetical protein
MELTLYKADFTIECWHEFCWRCDWKVGKECTLFNQKLKQENLGIFGEGPSILRCKACTNFCSNMPQEDIEE